MLIFSSNVELWKLALLSCTAVEDVKSNIILALHSHPTSKDLIVFMIHHLSKTFMRTNCHDIIHVIMEHIQEIGVNQFISVDELKLMLDRI